MSSLFARNWARAGGTARRRLASLSNDERGTTAIEFGMVAAPFFALLFGIISIGFYYFCVFSLENAVEAASRVIRTGTAQTQTNPTTGATQPMTATEFRNLVCSRLPAFMDCNGSSNKIRVNVTNFPGYGSITVPNCLDGSGDLIPTSGQGYNTGGASAIVLVTVCYEWELTKTLTNIPYWLRPTSSGGTSNTSRSMSNGSTLLQASVVFTTEPYQ